MYLSNSTLKTKLKNKFRLFFICGTVTRKRIIFAKPFALFHEQHVLMILLEHFTERNFIFLLLYYFLHCNFKVAAQMVWHSVPTISLYYSI